MKIAPDNQKETWNQFIIENNGSFLQSWQWGEFQESLSRKIWRLEIGSLKALLIKHNLPLEKSYLYCPRGPIGQISADGFRDFLAEVKKIAQQEKIIFFKIEPAGTLPEIPSLKQSKRQIQPTKTLILDISKSAEELLKQLHQKTRYNIRLAQRKGVSIEQAKAGDQKAINTFLNLLKETAKRDKFHLHPQSYYRKMLEVLVQEGMIKLLLAKYQNQIITVNLVCFFGQTATYLHGAADYNFRQLMASHFCQWQAICRAKKLGCQYYDFWGIDEEKWPGVTRFKKGFTGQEVNYPGSFDLVFQPLWYQLYHLARRFL